MTDEFDISKDEALGGLVGRRASRLLLLMELRAAHVVKQTRRAIWLVLNRKPVDQADFDFFDAIKITKEKTLRPVIQDLERHAQHWKDAIPGDPKTRAAIIRMLGQKYRFAYQDVPNLKAALGMDAQNVGAAYQSMFGRSIESVYFHETPPDNRPFWIQNPEWADIASLPELETEFELVFLKRGDTLFKQGAKSDALYVISGGRLRADQMGATGDAQFVREMGRGEIVGEFGVLSGEPRSMTVTAVRDTELVRLGKTGVDRLVEKHPRFMLQIIREVFNRISTHTDSKPKAKPLTIAVIGHTPDVPLSDFTRRLVAALKLHGKTQHLNHEKLNELFEPGAADADETTKDLNSKLVWFLNEQELAHRFLVFEADPVLSPWTQRCLRQADRILLLADASVSPELGQIEAWIADPTTTRVTGSMQLALLHATRGRASGTREWLARRRVEEHHHISLEDNRDVARLARFVNGSAVGLALGGGAQLGMAHIGVLRALKELQVEVDYVGGTSMGAIISAAVTAFDGDVERIAWLVRDFAKNVRRYADFTFPAVALMSGRKINRLFQEVYGDARIEDLWLKWFSIASNLSRGEPVVQQEGLLWRAVRASMSLPTVLPPVLQNGELLIDGGAFNNLPVDVMSKLVNGGPVIGVNVSPRHAITVKYHYPDDISGLDVATNRFRNQKLKYPSLLDTIMRSMILGSVNTWTAINEADLRIEAPIPPNTSFSLKAYDQLVEIGYKTARPLIAEWQARRRQTVLGGKMRAYRPNSDTTT